jgi:hypothetical protein
VRGVRGVRNGRGMHVVGGWVDGWMGEGLLWVWPDASPTALIESARSLAWPGT